MPASRPPAAPRTARSLAAAAVLGLSAAALLPSCAATTSYLRYKSSPDYPRDRDETLALPGLHHPVTVFIDDAGVAHVDAQDDIDLARATGFFQARNRFFEMDMLRRFARGRLSELVGEARILDGTTVAFDVSMRGWGMDRAAVRDADEADDGTREVLQAFADGVNAAVARYLPLEYRLLGVSPDPWRIEDSFAVGRLNAWGVTHNWQQELSRLLLSLSVGLDRATAIYGSDWWHGGFSLPAVEPLRDLPPAVAPELVDRFPAPGPDGASRGSIAASDGAATSGLTFTGASNSWVVAGDRTASGRPIEASDPHLAHMLPSLLYQQHLRAPGIDVIGAGIAGLPYVLIGHNRDVAWGMTSAVGDAVDLYVEQPNPADPDEVLTPDGWRRVEREPQVVRVRRGTAFEERRFELRRTANGPLLNDMYPGLLGPDAPLVALHWNPRNVAGSIRTLERAARARDVTELRESLLGLTTPPTTWTAADSSGAIALFVTGEIPTRRKHLGTFPVPGWVADYRWDDPPDPHRMPFVVSRSGFLAHANNVVRDPRSDQPFLHVDAAPSYRFDRIAELLGRSTAHTPQTMAAIQSDVKENRAVRLVPILLRDLHAAGRRWTAMQRQALQILERWDGEATVGSGGAAIFAVVYREAVVAALQDEVGKAVFDFLLSQRYSTNVADLWFDRADHPVWDDRGTARVETRRDVVVKAFRKAVAKLSRRMGVRPASWTWGRLHFVQIRHAFGGKSTLGGYVNLPPSQVGGGLDSVWKTHFDLGNHKDPFAVVAGPAYRQIVDLADVDHALWISDTGVSGWPGSPHYGDQHRAWREGGFVPMRYDWDEVRATAEAIVTLRPEPAGPEAR